MDTQTDLPFAGNPSRPREDRPRFDGATYDHERDSERLGSLLERVRELMGDGKSRTLREISDATGGSEASVSARLRDLRKPKFGELTVSREHVKGGLYRYRVGGEVTA